MPADGFFEWTGPKKARRPIWFHNPDGRLLYFAGLYASWQPEPDVWERTFTIITTNANAVVADVHDRMPVILAPEQAEEWMAARETDPEKLRTLLVPAADDLLIGTPVSDRANSVKNDDPSVLEEAPMLL